MIVAEVRKKTTASRKAIWDLWTNVSDWKTWDSDIISSTLNGKFTTGSTGVLKPKGGPQATLKIVEATECTCFTNRTKLPLCTISFIHKINSADDCIEVTHQIEMKGLLSFFFSRIMGKGMKKGLPKAVDKLIQMAENEI